MKRIAVLAASLALACSGDPADDGAQEGAAGASYECSGSGSRFVTEVTEFEFGSGQNFGQDSFPAPVLGPPQGGGPSAGSLDVTSLGEGGYVTLAFEGNVIVDGPGPDFIVFENAFSAGGASDVFAELGSVLLSQDGVSWVGYECDTSAYPYPGCAGSQAVLANADKNEIDPLDPEAAGGDAFDLAELDLEWARYVRIEDLPEAQGGEGTFDLDAVAIVNAGCP